MDNNIRLVKHSGQIFTPDFLVKEILDNCGYKGNDIIGKHIIDNSCGDGAFLCEIVNRYCQAFLAFQTDKEGLKADLQTYIHGIEIEIHAYQNCLFNLNQVVAEYGIGQVDWDISHRNTLSVSTYNGKMDYVVGNPPYVRVHNLENHYHQVKTFLFAEGGMTDLYLVFFEIGLHMLKEGGKLCYITPSSWLSSLAATNMRQYLVQQQILVSVTDLGHYQPFEGATTYTMISLFQKGVRHEQIDYFEYDGNARQRVFIDRLSLQDIWINQEFYISTKAHLRKLKDIMTYPSRKYVSVKNGFATLADKVFIGDLPFQQMMIPVVKASTGKWTTAFFPYDNNGKPFPKAEIFRHQKVAEYLEHHRQELLKGKTEEQKADWYLYGRTQALKDVFEDKLAISSLISDGNGLKINLVPKGSGVYSGLYILSDVPFKEVETLLRSDDFITYIKILKNYKSGGYYTFNSKVVEKYLNYQLTEKYHGIKNLPKKQSGIFESHLEFL